MDKDIEILQGDALTVLETMPDASAHVVITDPAYWTLDKWRGVGTTTRLGGGRAGDTDPDKFFPTVDWNYLAHCICEFDRILPKNGHAWIMCDGETAPFILNFVRETDDTLFSPCHKGYSKLYPVLKRARTGGYRQGMGYHGRGSHEYVILLEKGRRRFNDENWPDVFEFLWDGDSDTRKHTPSGKPYPTAKPTAFYERLLELSSNPGERALDCFAGSGTLGVAAREMGRKATLIDLADKSIQTMRSRLSLPAQGGLDYAG